MSPIPFSKQLWTPLPYDTFGKMLCTGFVKIHDHISSKHQISEPGERINGDISNASQSWFLMWNRFSCYGLVQILSPPQLCRLNFVCWSCDFLNSALTTQRRPIHLVTTLFLESQIFQIRPFIIPKSAIYGSIVYLVSGDSNFFQCSIDYFKKARSAGQCSICLSETIYMIFIVFWQIQNIVRPCS